MFRPESEERAVGAKYCASMKKLLQRSDFVMVVVNLSPQTHKLIGAKEFAMMKPNSTFINISRGNVIGWNKAIQLNRKQPCLRTTFLVIGLVVDQDALVDALRKKIIRAAALDVTYPEPLPRFVLLGTFLINKLAKITIRRIVKLQACFVFFVTVVV